jgi:hypothetical protein
MLHLPAAFGCWYCDDGDLKTLQQLLLQHLRPQLPGPWRWHFLMCGDVPEALVEYPQE